MNTRKSLFGNTLVEGVKPESWLKFGRDTRRIDATDRSSDQKRFFIALSLYPLSFFTNTPFNAQLTSHSIMYMIELCPNPVPGPSNQKQFGLLSCAIPR